MNISNLKHLVNAAFVTALILTTSVANAELINNGSLTGSIGNNLLPVGWFAGSTSASTANTPDTMNALNNSGLINYLDFGATASASPNGGTWVGVGRNGNVANESFSQTISSFVIGRLYSISWYDANFGIDSYNYKSTNQFVASLFNGSTNQFAFTGASRPLTEGWSLNTFDFVPTQTQYTLTFNLAGPARSYLSIDGISIDFSKNDPVTAVPEPSTWAFMLAGILMIGFQIRKQKIS